ncbi:MAG: hypothetical protein LBH87_03115 [Coriobacteriales bacterium]|jgi:hypothetical protein|nr:hypothetical protein [Coriobacteriales bacterium]
MGKARKLSVFISVLVACVLGVTLLASCSKAGVDTAANTPVEGNATVSENTTDTAAVDSSGNTSEEPKPIELIGGVASETEASGTAAITHNTDTTTTDEVFTSSKADENALRVEGGAKVTLNNLTVNKTGNTSNIGNSEAYGMNAGILVRNGGELAATGGNVNTDAAGASGVFVYNAGSSTTIAGAIITTKGNNSNGIAVAGGGNMHAINLYLTTRGNASPAISNNQGGGVLEVSQGSFTTTGIGSPALYSNAAVSVANAKLLACKSQAVIIEGQGSVVLDNCDISGYETQQSNSSTSSALAGVEGKATDWMSSEDLQTVLLYQGASADGSKGNTSFSMTGGKLTSKNGDVFHVTNANASIYLSRATLNNPVGRLLTVTGNDGSQGWGQPGSNGGSCNFAASSQVLSGDIVVDDTSSLNINLTDGTVFTGNILSGTSGTVSMKLSSDSTWSLSNDVYLSSFDGSINNIVTNGYHVYVGGEAIN